MALDNFVLPVLIMSQGDATRVQRELKALEEYIRQAELRQPGTPLQRLPKISRGLNDLAEINKLSLLKGEDRETADAFLSELVSKAPTVNIGFAVDPSAAFMAKITTWFRENVDRLVMVNVGLEPTIAAGCTLRTDNKFFDFSLRKHFDAQRSLLLSKIRGATKPI